jgi:rRNA maturation RNase YbeY
MSRAASLVAPGPWNELSLALCDDTTMAAVNCRHLGRPHSTDVISFRFDPMPGEPGGPSGEILVNVECAVRRLCLGSRWESSSWNASHELALYIAHGCDHLTGADDARQADRIRMRRRELRWLREAKDQGFSLAGLVAGARHPKRDAREAGT